MNEDVLSKVPALRKGVGFRRLFGEGVALVAETSKVSVLNETGARFLELSDGARTTEEILVVLEGEYEASREDLRRDVLSFLGQAVEAGLVELKPAP